MVRIPASAVDGVKRGIPVQCPHCRESFELTDALAAPLLERQRREIEDGDAAAAAALVERERKVREAEGRVAADRAAVEAEVSKRVQLDGASLLPKLLAQAREQARAERDAGTETVRQENDDLVKRVALLTDQVVELMKGKRDLEDADRERRLSAAREVERARDETRLQVEEQKRLEVADKDKTITSLKASLAEAQRIASVGSQQTQGETLELDIEGFLRREFPSDRIEPVAKGVAGADVLQRVVSNTGMECGSILWETKRTKAWSDAWVGKLTEDQAAAKAAFAVIASTVLPRDTSSIALRGNVVVTSLPCAPIIASILRRCVLDLGCARQALQGQHEKTALLYEYVQSDQFRGRLSAIIQATIALQAQLLKEKRATTAQWTKRQKQIELIALGIADLGGGIQGLLGASVPELPSLDLEALEAGEEPPEGPDDD